MVAATRRGPVPTSIDAAALSLIQEGLRGVVRLPTGTAHALASRGFPIAVMGKTGTTNEFRDAIFVGSTYGPDGITAAVRIGFDDNRSLGIERNRGEVSAAGVSGIDARRVSRQDRRGRAGVSGPDGSAHYGLPAAAHSFRSRQTSPVMPSHPCSARGISRTSPAETDWLLQNGMTVQTPLTPRGSCLRAPCAVLNPNAFSAAGPNGL